ncbi:MAG TPA: right-handed parallel beta-helix repeat-containing protein [Cyclobacteriaceae bacterium]|nr:right-handed parallel beta-helix repeat-containing protein [Cyclobacteriaceae bacterium]
MNRAAAFLFIAIIIPAVTVIAREYHVSMNGNNGNDGSELKPFRSINHAAQLANPGDIITVHAGTYREWVNPARGGDSDSKRIIYRAAPGEEVYIKGSEVITGWKKEKNGTWKVIIPNSFFGEYNPFKDPIYGDWFYDNGRIHHTGEVFLNGKSLYEKETLAKVIDPAPFEKTLDKEGSTFTWYCESDETNTTIWANFHNYNPGKALVEITTRRTCFYPEKPGINYITIRGFHICQAATQWGAPTAEQIGMIATHWNKGWIIENNRISDSKCSGITLGKERGTGHNVWLADQSIDGSLHYIEVTFRTLRNGWNKNNIGSHIVRNNEIYNCEQTGMCGSMGAAFSIIENNHIHHIWTKRQFEGAEIGGIKFHAAIDTKIEKNRIHDTGRGIWLDWMAQGTRVSKNLMYNNDLEDLFMEVNHGPTLIDNNLFLSEVGIVTQSQGGAVVHNIIAGMVAMWPEPNRFTPYHLPHSTEVAGLSTVFSGDYRFLNNIFLGIGPDPATKDARYHYGLAGFNDAILPVWISGNIYYHKAAPYKDEKNPVIYPDFKPDLDVAEEGDNVFLNYTLDSDPEIIKTQFVNTEVLGKAKMPKEGFENPNGTPLSIDTDYLNQIRSESDPDPGPFENPGRGAMRKKVW